MIQPSCSFCGKDQELAFLLIASPNNAGPIAYICDDCVDLCVDILCERREEDARERARERAKEVRSGGERVYPDSQFPPFPGKYEGRR